MVVSEGLATIFPLVLEGKNLTLDNLSKALMISEKTTNELIRQQSKLFEEIECNFDKNITPEIMRRYFISNYDEYIDDVPVKSGYFMGTKIVESLLGSGYTIETLTKLPAKEILSLWKK